IGLEHFQEDDITLAGVLDVMSRNSWNEAYIVCVEVHRAGLSFIHDYAHASLTREPKLPLASIRMPVQFTQRAGSESNQGGGDVLGNGKIAGVDDSNFAAIGLPSGLHGLHPERVLDGRFHVPSTDRCLVLRER